MLCYEHCYVKYIVTIRTAHFMLSINEDAHDLYSVCCDEIWVQQNMLFANVSICFWYCSHVNQTLYVIANIMLCDAMLCLIHLSLFVNVNSLCIKLRECNFSCKECLIYWISQTRNCLINNQNYLYYTIYCVLYCMAVYIVLSTLTCSQKFSQLLVYSGLHRAEIVFRNLHTHTHTRCASVEFICMPICSDVPSSSHHNSQPCCAVLPPLGECPWGS